MNNRKTAGVALAILLTFGGLSASMASAKGNKTVTATTVAPATTVAAKTTVAPATTVAAKTTVAPATTPTASVKIGASISATAIATAAKLTVGSTSKITLTISSGSTYGKISGASLKGVKKGTVKVKVTVMTGTASVSSYVMVDVA